MPLAHWRSAARMHETAVRTPFNIQSCAHTWRTAASQSLTARLHALAVPSPVMQGICCKSICFRTKPSTHGLFRRSKMISRDSRMSSRSDSRGQRRCYSKSKSSRIVCVSSWCSRVVASLLLHALGEAKRFVTVWRSFHAGSGRTYWGLERTIGVSQNLNLV